MAQQKWRQSLAGKFFGTVLLTAILCMIWNSSVMRASEIEWKGRIEAMPAAGLIGNWVVAGRAFTTTSATEFRQEKGAFAVGVCVEVEYVGQSSPFAATKIATKSSDDCSGGATTPTTTTPTTATTTPGASQTPVVSSTPSASPSATSSVTPQPGATNEVKARVERMPASGLLGTWLLSGVEYPITASTQLRQEKGPFVVGACVEVEFTSSTTPWTVYKLATKSADDCTSDGTPTGVPTTAPTSLPGGTEAELFGRLQSFPAGLVGDWNIGGMTFTANTSTEFDQRNSPFAVGATVKVHFTSDGNGGYLAREIETKFANDDQGSDDDGNGIFEGAEGHVFGRITTLPAGDQLGEWVVGGLTYTVDAATQLAPAPSSFAVDVQVRVNYFVNSQGQRLARKIELSTESGGTDDSNHVVLFSFITSMPPTGRIGEWTLGNVQFLAREATQFKEDHGRLGLGAYVKVEYFLSDGRPVLHELETHVPPGAGDNLIIGPIQTMGSGVAAAGVHAAIWQIGGESYLVTPATALYDQQSSLAVGATAAVNSYRAADGSQVATQIRGLTLDQRLYLPVVTR